MFQTHNGVDRDKARKRAEIEYALMHLGMAKRWYPLNGGSDTRRAVREALIERDAVRLRIPYATDGHSVTIGGFAPWTERGWRYVQCIGLKTGSWVNWRRAKRLKRKGLAKEVTY